MSCLGSLFCSDGVQWPPPSLCHARRPTSQRTTAELCINPQPRVPRKRRFSLKRPASWRTHVKRHEKTPVSSNANVNIDLLGEGLATIRVTRAYALQAHHMPVRHRTVIVDKRLNSILLEVNCLILTRF